MITITKNFLTWFFSNKSKKSLLLYGISTISVAFNLIITLVILTIMTNNWGSISPMFIGATMNYVPNGSITEKLLFVQNITMIISFGLMWFATLNILFKHMRKTNKYLAVLMFVPFVFYLSQFLIYSNPVIVDLITSNPYLYGVYLNLVIDSTKLVGSIIFGIVFIILAIKIPKTYQTRNYLILTAFGLIFLFMSNQAILLVTLPFPPFGLALVSTLGLATNLVFVGIYLSARSIAENSQLRNIIRESASQYDLHILDNISSAQLLSEIEGQVINVLNTHRENENEKIVVDAQEMKNYINEILDELRSEKI